MLQLKKFFLIVLVPVLAAAQKPLEREVRHELVMLPYYSVFDHLAFKVEDGTVTLYGQGPGRLSSPTPGTQ